MAGIPLIEQTGKKVHRLTIWVDPEEVPTIFLVVKDGVTALAHPDYISDTLHTVHQGDLTLEEAWDHLLIKTPEMAYPKPCEVVASTLDSVLVMADGKSVYRLTY
jgi:hypothetical protein